MLLKASISLASDPTTAAEELAAGVTDIEPDLAALWVSRHYRPDFGRLVSDVREAINARNLFGCTVESVIGPDREVEDQPAAALWVAKMPDVRILPFVLDQNDLMTLKEPAEWHDRLGVTAEDKPAFLLVPEPFSIQFGVALNFMDEAFGGSPIIGGVASGARNPGQNRLFLNDQELRQGMVGVSLSGPVTIDTVVSQGCRPMGPRHVITRAESNIIYELGGREAYAVLREVHDQVSPADRALMQNGLHIGRVIDEHREHFGPGDFLVRNVVGAVDNRGLAITDHFRTGQTVQFHVRDAATAEEEMRSLIRSKLVEIGGTPRGGLVFSCNGRGTRLFSEPNHDIKLINELMPECPMAGFFAAGEIGPVGGKTFVHGFTSCLALFCEP